MSQITQVKKWSLRQHEWCFVPGKGLQKHLQLSSRWWDHCLLLWLFCFLRGCHCLALLSDSTGLSCLFPCSVMLSFHASCSSWLVFLLLCTVPLPYCVPLHLHLLASFPPSLLLGLRPCAGCQALESSRADSHGAFLLRWTSLLLVEQPCWKEQHCCWCWFLAVPVLQFFYPPPLWKHPSWLFL